MRCVLSNLLVAAVIAVSGAALADAPRITGVASTTDGDTLSLGPVRIRLHGIDAPEAGQQCRRADGKSWQCGTEATNRLAELVEGQVIECRALDRNAYGRIIAAC